jgi:hypothetical protein
MPSLKYYLIQVCKEIEKLNPKAVIHRTEPFETEDASLIVYTDEADIPYIRSKVIEVTGELLLKGGPFIAVSILPRKVERSEAASR